MSNPENKSQVSSGKWRLSEADIDEIIESLDGTGGWIIKQGELRYWIEHFVNNQIKPETVKEAYERLSRSEVDADRICADFRALGYKDEYDLGLSIHGTYSHLITTTDVKNVLHFLFSIGFDVIKINKP